MHVAQYLGCKASCTHGGTAPPARPLPAGGRWRCVSHYVQRARLNLALLDQQDLVGRTGELARTFGIDFFAGGRAWWWVC